MSKVEGGVVCVCVCVCAQSKAPGPQRARFLWWYVEARKFDNSVAKRQTFRDADVDMAEPAALLAASSASSSLRPAPSPTSGLAP